MTSAFPSWVLSCCLLSHVAFWLVFGNNFTNADSIAGQYRPMPGLFPINSMQHFRVLVSTDVCEWLNSQCDFCPLSLAAAFELTLTKVLLLFLPPLHGTAAMAVFVRAQLC